MICVKTRKRCVVIALAILLSGLAMGSIDVAANNNGQKAQDLNTIIKEIKKQKSAEERKLEDSKRKSNRLKTEERREERNYDNLVKTMDSIKREEALLDKAIEEATARCDEQRKKLQVRIRAVYKNANMSYVKAIAEAKSLADFAGRVEIISRISKADRELLESINNDRLDIEFKKRQKEAERDNAARKANEAKRNIERKKISRAKVDDSIAALRKKLARLESQENELIKKSNELTKDIRALQGNFTKCQPGKMLWPLPSSKRITSPFGTRIHPIYKTKKTHHGIDIGANSGSSILAAKDGKVIIAGWQGGYGNAVIIDHGGGITTVYAHCSKLIAKKGQYVKMGDLIAKVGSTGISTGPHLHFEVRKNGTVVNPLDYTNM